MSSLSNVVLLPEQKEILTMIQENKLDGFYSEIVEQFSNEALFKDMSFEDRLKRCLEAYNEHVSNNRFKRLLLNSKIRNKVYLRQISPAPSRGLSNELLLKLKDGDFLNKAINIVITGPTGTGNYVKLRIM